MDGEILASSDMHKACLRMSETDSVRIPVICAKSGAHRGIIFVVDGLYADQCEKNKREHSKVFDEA